MEEPDFLPSVGAVFAVPAFFGICFSPFKELFK
jgi:hypothetical protein